MTRADAVSIASQFGFPLNRDFHSLSSDTVQRIIDAADSERYRTPRNANGSRARYFYARLNRSK